MYFITMWRLSNNKWSLEILDLKRHILVVSDQRNVILKGLDDFSKREQLYNEHRSSQRFLQFNELSQELALDSRFIETIKEITKSGVNDEDDEALVAAVKEMLEENDFFRDSPRLGSSCSEKTRICDDDIYRSVDGSCNNLEHSEWGATGRVLLRQDLIESVERLKLTDHFPGLCGTHMKMVNQSPEEVCPRPCPVPGQSVLQCIMNQATPTTSTLRTGHPTPQPRT